MARQKLNDHTLYESDSIVSKNDADWFRESCICREFNFLSRQRTTMVEFVLWNKGTKQHSLAVATTVDNFRDIEGEGEIARAHAALVKLGGKPPPLDEVLDRKSVRVTPLSPKGNP
jgi:hypothetical protein